MKTVIVDDAGHADRAVTRALTEAAAGFLDSPRR